MAGRTVSKFSRIYVDGYDMSGYSRAAPSLGWRFNPGAWKALSDPAVGVLPGQAQVNLGTYNGVLDNTATSGMHARMSSSDATRDIMVAIGDRAAPTVGVPAFCAQVTQNSYQAQPGDGIVTVSMDLGGWDERADSNTYPLPWGYLLHAKGTRTAANSSSGATAIVDNSAASTNGGYMMYQIFPLSNTGTATLTVEHSTGGAWTNCTGLTYSITNSAAAASGIVNTTTTGSTINRYTRWQLSLGTSTGVQFALALVRGR